MKKTYYSRQILMLISHVYLAVFLAIATTFLVTKFYNYSPNQSPEIRSYVLQNVVQGNYQDSLKQEAKERLIYLLIVILLPSLILVSMFFSQKLLQKVNAETVDLIAKILIFISSFYAWLGVFLVISTSNFLINVSLKMETYLYHKEIYSSGRIIICTFLMASSAMLYRFFFKEYSRKITEKVLAVLVLILAIFICSYSLFDEYNIEPFSGNLSPIIYPVIQVFLGKMPLIDLKVLYGLYPIFLQPVFHLFGLTLFSLSMILASLLLIALLSIAFCLFSIIKNKLIAFITFVAILYFLFPASTWWPEPGAVIFQYEPIRLLFPSLLLVFLCLFFKKPTRLKYYSSLIFFALGTMWNLDVGIATFITLVVILCYEKFSLKSAAIHLVIACGILVLVWGLFFIFLKLEYQQPINFASMLYGQKAAQEFGYAAIAIPRVGLWYIEVLVYLTGYVFTIHNFLNKKYSLQDNFIAVTTLLGTGLFIYFIFRSHDSNLFHSCYPALILLAIFADKFISSFNSKKFKPELLLFSLPLLFLCYFASAFFLNISSNKALLEVNKKTKEYPSWKREIDFVKTHIPASPAMVRDDILFLSLNSMEYYFALEFHARFPKDFVNIIHLFYQEEFDELFGEIADGKSRWLILSESSRSGNNPLAFSDKEILLLKNHILKYYKISSQMPGLIIYEKSAIENHNALNSL